HVRGPGRLRIRDRKRRRDAARVVGHRLVGEIQSRQELAILAEVDADAPGHLAALGAALLTEALEFLIGHAEQVVCALAAAAAFDLQLLEAVLAGRDARLGERLLRRLLSRHADDAARRVAVHRRARAAYDLDLARHP